jgi:hypothetical protein
VGAVEGLELVEAPIEADELGRADRREVGRVAEEDHPLALVVVGELDVALCGGGLEGRGEFTDQGQVLGAGLDDPKGTQSITTDFAIGDLGYVMALTVAGPEGSTKIHSGPGDFWEFGKWYRNILSYDKVGDKVDFKFLERETGKIVWDPDPLSVAGGDFTRELFFLGGSRYGVGDTGYDGIDRNAEFVGDIDNVYLTPEPATVLLLGLGGLVLRRRRR